MYTSGPLHARWPVSFEIEKTLSNDNSTGNQFVVGDP